MDKQATEQPPSLHRKTEETCTKSFVDDTFDPGKSGSCHIIIELSASAVSFCILDTLSNKYIALGREAIASGGMAASCAHLLTLRKSHELLMLNYRSASLLLVNELFTTVPAPLFEPERARDFLAFNTEESIMISGEMEVLTDKLNGAEAFNIYAIPKQVWTALNAEFPGLRPMHHTSCLINTLLDRFKNQGQEICFVHIQEGLFTMVVISGNNLRFCNNFTYGSSEDLAYYTLFVCEQLKLNPESVRMVLLGEVDKASADYRILYKYIRHLRFIDRHPGFSYSYTFDSLPGHYYFNLFSRYHCES